MAARRFVAVGQRAIGCHRVRICRSDICAVVVTYFPEADTAQNLQALASQVGRILVVDNGSSPELLEPIESVDVGATIVRLGSNLGIAAALNTALRSAHEQGFSWLATFDQDSTATPDMVAEMGHVLSAYPQPDLVGLIAPRHKDRRSGVVVRDGKPERQGVGWSVIRTTMTSGNLVNIAAAQAVGGFDDSLFIDYVDHDFCLRLRKHGYRILEADNAVLDHALGRLEVRDLGLVNMGVTHHSALRRYYMTRNRMLVWRRYWRQEPRWVARDLRRFITESLGVVLFEKERRLKLRMMRQGIGDAIGGRSGPHRANRDSGDS
jgi:rhamnosyltransferase